MVASRIRRITVVGPSAGTAPPVREKALLHWKKTWERSTKLLSDVGCASTSSFNRSTRARSSGLR